MKSKHLYFILVGCLILLSLGLGGMAYESNVLLTKRSSKLADAKALSQAALDQQTQLKRNVSDIQKYSDLNKIAKTIVPQDKDQAEAVREIVSLAAQSGISQLTSITFPVSTLGGTAAPVAPGTKAVPSPNTGITQVTPVLGIIGVYDLQITVTQDTNNRVPYGSFTTFLTKLEQNRRTAQVSGITVQPNPQDPSKVAFTLIIDEFIKP